MKISTFCCGLGFATDSKISGVGEGSPLQRIALIKVDGKVLEFVRAGSYFGIVVRLGSAGPDSIAILRAGNVHGPR